jgi:hypothetical protein
VLPAVVHLKLEPADKGGEASMGLEARHVQVGDQVDHSHSPKSMRDILIIGLFIKGPVVASAHLVEEVLGSCP